MKYKLCLPSDVFWQNKRKNPDLLRNLVWLSRVTANYILTYGLKNFRYRVGKMAITLTVNLQ